MDDLSRRSFLGGVLTVAAAVVIPVSLKEPVPTLWGDGIHDDSPALRAFLAGNPFQTADGFIGTVEEGRIAGGYFLLSNPLEAYIPHSRKLIFENCRFAWEWNKTAEIFTDSHIMPPTFLEIKNG